MGDMTSEYRISVGKHLRKRNSLGIPRMKKLQKTKQRHDFPEAADSNSTGQKTSYLYGTRMFITEFTKASH